MRILLAVDGSKHSLGAVDCLIEHANWYREKPVVGLVAEMIVDHASKTRRELIFIGTHRRTEAGNMLLGSTATKVLHISKTPVLLVR